MTGSNGRGDWSPRFFFLVLDNGRIDAFDTHDNLLKTNAIYQEIYHSQMEGGGDFDQPA